MSSDYSSACYNSYIRLVIYLRRFVYGKNYKSNKWDNSF